MEGAWGCRAREEAAAHRARLPWVEVLLLGQVLLLMEEEEEVQSQVEEEEQLQVEEEEQSQVEEEEQPQEEEVGHVEVAGEEAAEAEGGCLVA